MSDFLMIGGTRVPVFAPSGADEEYQEIGGEMVRAFGGRLLSTVKGRARVWRLQTPPLPESEAQMLAAVLAHGSPLLCSGALIGSDAVSCYARGVRTRPVAPLSRLRRVVEFELHEAAPMASPILFRLHAGEPLPAGMSFSRASTATLIDRTGTLREVGPHVPRIDWSHGRPALRLEPQRMNGWTWSEDLSQSVWMKDGISVMTNVATAPDGQVTMDKVVEDATTGAHQIRRALAGASDNTKQAISFWAAAAERTWVRIGTNGKNSTSVASSFFNLATGEFGTVASNHSLRVIERAGSAYRLECVFDVGSGAETPQFRVGPTTGNATSTYTGDGTSGIYLWGLSFEADRPFASSYIKTTSTTVTRATDTTIATWAHGLISCSPYFRFVDTGAADLSAATIAVWMFGDDIGSGRIWLRSAASTPTYTIVLRDARGVASEVSTSPGITTQIGDLVELMPQIEVSAQGVRARLIQAVNGGAPATSAWTPYVQADWTPTTMRLGSLTPTQFDLLDAIVLRGAGWTMDDVRRLVR